MNLIKNVDKKIDIEVCSALEIFNKKMEIYGQPSLVFVKNVVITDFNGG